MIYTVGGIKGGTGKSTVATNLAVWLSQKGKDVLLVDTDMQGTSTDFTLQRESTLGGNAGFACIKMVGRQVMAELQKMRSKFDDIVVDAGGGSDTTGQRSAIVLADCFLLPLRPKGFDVWTAELVSDLIAQAQALREEDLRVYAFLSQAPARSQDNRDAAETLAGIEGVTFLSEIQLGYRNAYSTAGLRGLCVNELTPTDQKAVKEINALFSTITNL